MLQQQEPECSRLGGCVSLSQHARSLAENEVCSTEELNWNCIFPLSFSPVSVLVFLKHCYAEDVGGHKIRSQLLVSSKVFDGPKTIVSLLQKIDDMKP